MATTDTSEWRLVGTTLAASSTDRILPVISSHFYSVLNESGSGEVSIPLDSAAAGVVTEGMLAVLYYRGAIRASFLIENIRKVPASSQEEAGQVLSISGRGGMTLLDRAIVWSDGTTATTRTYTAQTKAAILISLITEAQARGGLGTLTYDFTATDDSDSVAWTDSEDYDLTVGTSMLDVLRQFAKTGIEFEMNYSGSGFVLSAYKNGIGTDKSSTVYFRIGTNCQEIDIDQRGNDIKNALLVAYQEGNVALSDATSITANGRREELIDARLAQSSASAVTYGAALLSTKKDTQIGRTIKVYDGIPPYLFINYILGDTVTLDIDGVKTSDRVLGIQCDFDNGEYSNVVIELNSLMLEQNLKMQQDIDYLLNQWNTANDAGLLEVSFWAAIGDPNISYTVTDSLLVGTKIYFLGTGASAALVSYEISTGTWSTLVNNTSIQTPYVMDIYGTDIYIGTAHAVYKFDTLTSTLSLIADVVYGGEPMAEAIYSLAVMGDNLYVGGRFDSIDGVTMTGVGKLSLLTSTWSDIGGDGFAISMLVDGSNLYVGGVALTMWNGTVWSTIGTFAGAGIIQTIAIYGTSILVGTSAVATGGIFEWDGLVWAVFGGGVNNQVTGIAVYLTDVYVVGAFTDAGNRIARYSGGAWWQLGTGLDAICRDIVLYNDDVYVSGDFTTAGDKPANKVAAYFNNFESLVDYLENSSSSFNMGAAIHAAEASAITDTDEIPFWEATANALRKITWANIKATLKTYFDTLYVALTVLIDSKDPTGWIDPSAITVSYDSTARTITLTGTLSYYWRGVKTTLTSPWTSSAHTATNGGWFLSSTDGINFTWSTTVWTFDALMVAFASYGTTYKFALRETHGLMQWQTHEELHSTIGTYKESGGALSGYTLLSTTAANRRPDVASTHLHDEDNETTNAALTSKLYNKLYLAGSTPTITYTGETADIVPLLANNPYYNAYAAPNWIQTLMANNSYMSVWLVAIPTTADATSQTYRYTWIQGQSNTNLAGQTALTPSDLNLAAFATEATEFVFLAKIIIRYTGGNWDLYSVTVLTGNRMIQVGSPAGAYLSSVATDATLTGDGSLASPLSVVGGGGGTPGGSDTHVQYNNGGAFGGESDFAWEDVTKTFLIGGSNWYSALSALTGGIHVSKDGGGAYTNVVTGHSWVNGVDDFTGVPGFGADRAGGSRATPTAVLDNMGLARFTGGGYDGTTLSGTRAQILLRAAGNWSGTSHPTKIELWTTPSGSVTRRKVLTVGEDGNVDILTGKTYNINGSPHTHAHNDATSLQGGTAGEYYHLTSADNTEAVAFLNGGTSTHTDVDAGLLTATQKTDLTDGGVTTLHTHSGIGGGAFQRNLAADLTLADGECLVITGYLDLATYSLTLGGDAQLEVL